MTANDVWFAIPSASLERCHRTLPAWRDMGYKVAVLQDRERGPVPADVIIEVDSYPGWAASVNLLCERVVPPNAPVVVSGGDDMFPDPDHRASEILEQFRSRFPDGFGVMQPHGDDFVETRQFCGSPWFGRAWIDRMYGGTGPMFQGYVHHGADDELYWLSRCMGALWTRNDLTQYHDHFVRRGEAAPQWWMESVDQHDRRDTQLFIARAAHAFPGHEPTEGDARFDHARFQDEYTGRAEKHWAARYGAADGNDPAPTQMTRALTACRGKGLHRVMLFGAGRFTERAGTALMQPPVDVLGIIDDDPARGGTSMWNYPILDRTAAAELQPDAVVISSDTIEERLEAAARAFLAPGTPVFRL